MKRPQLSLRDLFWLVLVTACLCSWWADRSWLVHDHRTVLHKVSETMRREAPWLEESNTPDWASNLMRQEAHAKWKRQNL